VYVLAFHSKYITNYIDNLCILYAWDIVDYIKETNIRNIGRYKIIKYLRIQYPKLLTVDLEFYKYVCNMYNLCYNVFYIIIYSGNNLDDKLPQGQRLVYHIYFYHACIVTFITLIHIIYMLKLTCKLNLQVDNGMIQVQNDEESHLTRDEINNIKRTITIEIIEDTQQIDLSVSNKIYKHHDDEGNEVCPICFQQPDGDNKIIILKCNHTICDTCLSQYIQINRKNINCPHCKVVLC